ncbi:acyltransferase family protein [Gemmatirosa kalamazoonensis]|nr:acyltransferase [Gemmatirosa kalamazoonensis]
MSGHQPALDGVRGIAVLLVVIFHTTHLSYETAVGRVVWWLAGAGWTGVDLFFVLSGFLITGILFDAKGKANYFRNFYIRRVLRIFPLYYAVLAVSFLVLPSLAGALALDSRVTTQGFVWYVLYLSNYYQLSIPWTHPVLGVVWSLAIEEQFYMAWPLLIASVSAKRVARLCAIVAGLAVAVRTGLTIAGLNGEATYVVTFCRMDALAVGGLLAVTLRTSRAAARQWLRPALAAAVPVIAAMVLLPMGSTYNVLKDTIGYTATAILFAGLVYAAVTGSAENVVRRACSSSVLRLFGRYSYAIYLVHSPLDAILRRKLFPTPLRQIAGSDLPTQAAYYAVAIGLSLGLALVSWNLFEKHFLRLKDHFPYGKASAAGPAAAPIAATLQSPEPA